MMACHVSATEYDNVMAHLNEEQRQLLNDYRKPTLEFNSHSLTRFNPVSLVSFQLTADTNPMNGAAFQLGAQYRSWAVHPDFNNLNYNTYSTEFTISSPLIKRWILPMPFEKNPNCAQKSCWIKWCSTAPLL